MQTLALEEITKENLLEALEKGSLRLRRSDGQIFVVTKVPQTSSPFDVPPVPVSLTASEIVASVHEGRERIDEE